jgi:hypothetical protein
MHIVPTHLQSQPHQVRPMRAASKILRRLINSGLPATATAEERAAADKILAGSLSADCRDERRIPSHDNGVAIRFGCRHKTGVELMPAVAHSTPSKYDGKVEILMTSDRRRRRLFPGAILPSSSEAAFATPAGRPAANRFCGVQQLDGRSLRGIDGVWKGLFECSLGLTIDHAPRAQKIRQPSSGGGQSVEIFCSRNRSLAHRPFWVKAPCRLQRQVAGFGFPNRS